jgi:hypothetical protein
MNQVLTPTEFLAIIGVISTCTAILGYLAGTVRERLRNQKSPRFILR